MALKFMENFFPYAAEGVSLDAANNQFDTGWITHGSESVMIVPGFHDGSKALNLNRTGSTYARVERRFTTTSNEHIIGYAFRATDREAVTFQIKDDETVIMEIEWPNQFKVNSTTGNATILLNKLYYVEVKLDRTTKEITVNVNGYPYITETTLETIPETIQCFWGYGSAGTAAYITISDIYYADGSAGEFTDFIGPQKVTSRIIDAIEASDWEEHPLGKDKVEIMNNIPPKIDEYTESDNVGDRDLYSSTDEVDEHAVINAVAVTTLVTKTDIDDQYIALAISDGDVDKHSDDFPVQMQPTYIQAVFEQNLEDNSWDKATVEGTFFGPVIRPRPDPEP